MTARVLAQRVLPFVKSTCELPVQSLLINTRSATATTRIGNTATRSLHSTSVNNSGKPHYSPLIRAVLKGHGKVYGLPNVEGSHHIQTAIKSGPTIIAAAPHRFDPTDTIVIAQAHQLTHQDDIPLSEETIAGIKLGAEATLALFQQMTFEEFSALLDHHRPRKNTSRDSDVTAAKARELNDAIRKEFEFIKQHLSALSELCDQWIDAAQHNQLPEYVDSSCYDAKQRKLLTVVAREEMKKHVFLGPLLNAVNACFVSRSTEGATGGLKEELQQRLNHVTPIIYPESARGRVDSNAVYRFRPGASMIAGGLQALQVITAIDYRKQTRVVFTPPLRIGQNPKHQLPPLFANKLAQLVIAEILGLQASHHYLHGDYKPRAPTGLPPID